MYDIKPLEEEWAKYRKKKRRPYIIILILIFLTAAGIAAFYYTKDMYPLLIDKNNTVNKSNKKRKVEKKAFVFIENKALSTLEVHEKEAAEILENSHETIEDLPLQNDRPLRKKPRVKMNIITTEMPKPKKKTEENKPHKRKYLAIKESSSLKAYKDVAKRFRETKDTDDSLFLARTYYHMRKYKKAEYWALQTNNVNSNIEESILIFVKAKVKLGHKNEAIRILSKYIKGSNSPEAKTLLKQIKKGKL